MNVYRKKKTKMVALYIVLSMICIQLFSPLVSEVRAEEEIKYAATYSGVQREPLNLRDGTYLFDNVTVTGTSSHPSAIEVQGKVTIVLKGKSKITGYDSRWVGDSQLPSGAGIKVEKTNGYANTVTIQGDKTSSLYVKGGNANKGQDGKNGTDASTRNGGSGGQGGVGGNGASAAIGATGGLGGRNKSTFKGKDAGNVKLLGQFELETVGGSGGAGGRGGNGGSSNGDWAFFWTSIASGGGGGGGGGGGYPAPGIGGGGGAGDVGGNGADGEGTKTTTLAAFNESGGGGGGGARGWGAGGGGGTGFFAYYVGQPKYYTWIRPQGGKGGKSPTEYGLGGEVGIMECSQGGSGSGKSGGAYILRLGSYSGDAVSVDDKFAVTNGFIYTARTIPTDIQQRRNGRKFAGLGARTTREMSDWGGYGLDSAWAFIMQGGKETPEATNGGGAARRYEIWIRGGDDSDGGMAESSKGGAGGKIDKSENVDFNPDEGGTGNGGAPDKNPGTDPSPVQIIIDLSHPDTKVTFTPPKGIYDGKEVNPGIQIISSTGIKVDPKAYTVVTTGDLKGPGKVTYTFTGKGEEYPNQMVVNATDREYIIEKGIRKSYIKEADDIYTRDMLSVFNVVIANYNDDNNTVTWTVEQDNDPNTPEVGYNLIDNGKGGLVIESTAGVGKIHVKASISEGNKYLKQDLESITLYITPAGAESFSISKIDDQRYTGNEITPPFVVNFGSKVLEAGKDYDFRYENNVEVGRAKVIVVGKGDYEGEINGYFNIIPADITPIRFDNADYTKSPPTLQDLYYTSYPQTSNPIHGVIGDKELVEGIDYLVTYSNLTEVGKVVVTIVGIGNYTGSTTLEYRILPVDINHIPGLSIIEPEDVVYDKTEKKAKPRVIFNGRELEEGKDYTLSYENHVLAGEATVYVHGLGNFTSESFMTTHFIIKQRPIYVVPDEGQGKIAGDKDPKKYTFTVDGVIAGDQVSFMDGSEIYRVFGDAVGNYPFSIGSLALNYGSDDNDNYVLKMSPDQVNFEIKAYETDAEAIIRGEVIDKETGERAVVNADTGWYNHKVEVVAPEGYLISRNCLLDGEDATAETSFWQPYFMSEDGDFSKEGQTYYLMKKPEKEGEASHISQPKQAKFKQDSVLPINRIEMNNKKIYTEYTKGLKFDTYFKDEVNMDIIASDATSGVQSNQYYLSDTELSQKELKELPEASWKDGSSLLEYSLKLTDEMKKIAYVRTADIAGNVTYVNTDGFTIDKTKPSIALEYANPGKWVADKDARVKVKVVETLSGIDERYMDYHYEFKEDGKVSDSYLIKLDKDGNAIVNGLADGNYDFIVTAKDKAGNVETAQTHIMIDTVTPLLEVKGNVTDYATSKDVDIIANVGASKVDKVYVQKKGLGQACDVHGTWVEITNEYQTDKKYNVDENGTYYFKYVNGAGVTSNIATISFDTIDKNKPSADVRAITVRDGQSYHSVWTKDDVQVFFKNSTNNLGDTKYSYRLQKDGDVEWGDWQSTTRKNDYEASVILSQSGEIHMQMQVTSAAGMSSDIEEFTVKIDKQNPTATVELLDKSWSTIINKPGFKDFSNQNQKFVVRGKDSLSGVVNIQYILLKGTDAKQAYKASELEDLAVSKGGWSTGIFDPLTNSIDVGIQADNTYIIYAKVFDKVGNIRYVSSDGVVIDATKPDLIVDKSIMKEYLYPVGSDGLWITEPFATLPTTLTDTLAGADKLKTSYNNGVELVSNEYDISSGNYDIANLKDGIYDFIVQGYDKAGNMAEEIIKVRKDTVRPDVTLVADNVNIGKRKHVEMEPIVGTSGLKSLGYQYVLEGDTYNPNDTWHDITVSYAAGYDVTAKGTLYVRVENNLGIVNIVEVTFDNIQEAPVKIAVDTVNEDNEIIRVSDEGWYPEISVRFYNEPKNVSDFIYEYHEGDGVLKTVTADEEGYAYIKAAEGTTTYYMRITNPESGKTDEANITVHVDTTKPTGILKTTATNSREWLDAATKRTIDYGLKTSVDVELKDVYDAVGSSGLHEVQYYVMTAGKNTQLKTFPEDEKAIKKELVGEWLPVTNAQMKKLKNGESIILDTLKADQEYMVYVRVKDIAGNVRYISSDGITIDASKPIITTDYKEATWLTKEDQDVHVTIKDQLSGVKDGTYKVVFEGAETPYTYHCNNRDGVFIIPANQLKNGTNEVTIEASDVAGNISESFVVSILKDTVKPVIHIEEGNNNTHRVGIEIDKLGVSGVKRVYVTCDNGAFEEVDITSAYTEGIQIPRNGTYTFILVNQAGVASDPVTYTTDELGEPPVVHIQGIDQNGTAYTEDSWSSLPISMQVTVEDVMIGKGTYEYSLDGKTWTMMNTDTNDQYWITQDVDGEYNYRFRVIAPDGAMSDIVSYKVKIDTTVPEFTYEITPKTNTNKWVDVRIMPKTESTALEYSFDGGDSYQKEPVKRFISNGYVDMVVKNATGTTASKTTEIRNIDRLQPRMAVYENRISDTGMYTVEMEVNDAPENLDFIETGINQVFITKDNPYSETNVRTVPLVTDYVLELKDNQHYETNGEFKAEATGNTKDNYWIIATDNVGNYKIKSFRVNPQTNKPEEIPIPPQPDQPGDNEDIKDDIDDIIDLETENPSIENLIVKEKLVNNVIDNTLRDLPDDSAEKKEILETLDQLNLSDEQRKQVKEQQRLLVQNDQKNIYIWIPIVIVMGLSFMYFCYKKHQLDEAYQEDAEG